MRSVHFWHFRYDMLMEALELREAPSMSDFWVCAAAAFLAKSFHTITLHATFATSGHTIRRIYIIPYLPWIVFRGDRVLPMLSLYDVIHLPTLVTGQDLATQRNRVLFSWYLP